jgi:uncharacterized protein (DUF1330 family)
MIYLTQLIYLKPGEEKAFLEFEDHAIPLMRKYLGNLLLRIRPEKGEIVDGSMETPYEIHFISFPSENDLKNFLADDERKKIFHLKEQSIRSTLLILGKPI